MSVVNPILYNKKLVAAKIKPRAVEVPRYIQILLTTNRIQELQDDDEKARLFLRLLFKCKLRGTTVVRHFKHLKPNLFPTTSILPNSMAFDQANDRPPQLRGANFKQIEKLIEYVKALDSGIVYKWCILMALYTGLRSSEVVQLKTSHLIGLLNKKETIPIIRKNNVSWQVIYYGEFNEFLAEVAAQYKESLEFFSQHQVDILLFNFTTQALHYKLKEYCRLANRGQPPSCGFGLHVFRYYVASKLATQKLDVAQIFLAHKNQRTTEKYIRYNDVQKEQEIVEMNQNNELYKNVNLKLLDKINTLPTQSVQCIEF